MIIALGSFIPGSPHVLRGGFTIREDGSDQLFETTADFFFDGSPAPGFALHSGIPMNPTDNALRANMAQTRFLDLPGNLVEVHGLHAGPIQPPVDIDAYNTVVLWCFAVPFILGYGIIKRP